MRPPDARDRKEWPDRPWRAAPANVFLRARFAIEVCYLNGIGYKKNGDEFWVFGMIWIWTRRKRLALTDSPASSGTPWPLCPKFPLYYRHSPNYHVRICWSPRSAPSALVWRVHKTATCDWQVRCWPTFERYFRCAADSPFADNNWSHSEWLVFSSKTENSPWVICVW